MYIIGVDIGGTNIKVGLIKENNIVDKIVVPTNTFDLIKQITSLIDSIIDKNHLEISNIRGIGVGCPGIVENGIVVESANLQLKDIALQQLLEDNYKTNIVVKNDGEMATLGEYCVANDVDNMILLTIGTGVGGGIILNRKLFESNKGYGELGHITLMYHGKECNCGRKGCLEQYVSYKALLNLAKDKYRDTIPYDDLSAEMIYERYKRNEGFAVDIIEEYTDYLAEGLLDYCNIFRPDRIVIGGGISYVPEIINIVKNKCYLQNYGYKNSDKVEIVPAKLKNDAGIMGARAVFDTLI